MPCNNAANPNSKKDNISLFKTFTGNIDYYISAAGTRDWDFTTQGAVDLNVVISGAVKHAYLYWNVIGAKNQNAANVVFNGQNIVGKNIAWCGNTDWPRTLADGSTPQDAANSNIINKVYRADVTSLAINGINTAEIVGSLPDPTTSPSGDMAHFPGCNGSQGLALVTVFESTELTKVMIYDGAKLMMPPALVPILGGQSDYKLAVNPGDFTYQGGFGTAVGDAQSDLPDSFIWNGQTVSSNYFVPNAGNLLFMNVEHGLHIKRKNVAEIKTNSDALCWFLAVYGGRKICCPYVKTPTPDPAIKDQLTFFRGFQGNYKALLVGSGTRDVPINVSPALMPVSLPGKIKAAYLYWNVLVSGNYDAPIAVINNVPVYGCMVGWCGNTCWTGCCPNTGLVPPGSGNQYTINKVYRADVTKWLDNPGANPVTIPGISRSTCTVPTLADNPYLPNCNSSQGLCLLVIYDDGAPEFEDVKSCCPGHKTRYHLQRQILISDGCVQITPAPTPGPYGGGFPSYDVMVNSHYNNNIEIATCVGDAQTDLDDMFAWNDVPFNLPGTSYFNPNCGNLLALNTEIIGGNGNCNCKTPETNVATASSTDDCLSWFLFVYYGELTCVIPKVHTTPQKIRSMRSTC